MEIGLWNVLIGNPVFLVIWFVIGFREIEVLIPEPLSLVCQLSEISLELVKLSPLLREKLLMLGGVRSTEVLMLCGSARLPGDL